MGPDNGLLMPAAERFGGGVEAVEISRSPWRLEPVSATFHGRDVFAPVAARLAAGERSRRPASRSIPTSSSRSSCRARASRTARSSCTWSASTASATSCSTRPRRPRRRLRLEPIRCGGGRARRAVRTDLRRRRAPASSCSTRTPAARSRWPSTAARRRRCSALRRGDEMRVGAGVTRSGRRGCICAGPDSTNARARALAAEGAPHGTLVTAGEQTAGRGRQGRDVERAPGPRAAGLDRAARARRAAVARAGLAVADVAGPAARIKWPNDVLLDGRKVAGDARGGPPAGGLGGARDRRQRRASTSPTCRRSCTRRRGRSASSRPSSSRRWTSCSRALEARLAEPAGGHARRPARARRARRATVRWADGERGRARDRRRGAPARRVADGDGPRARRRRGAPREDRRGRPRSRPRWLLEPVDRQHVTGTPSSTPWGAVVSGRSGGGSRARRCRRRAR